MNALKIAALLLIIGGILALAYGGFSYTKTTHRTDIGALHLAIDDTRHVNIPLWAGVGAIAGGALLLATSRKTFKTKTYGV